MNALLIFVIGIGLWVTCSSAFSSCVNLGKGGPVIRAVNAVALTALVVAACLVNGNLAGLPVLVPAFLAMGAGDVLLMMSSQVPVGWDGGQMVGEKKKSNLFLIGTVVFLLAYTCLDVWAIGAPLVSWVTWLACAIGFLALNAGQYLSLDKNAMKGKETALIVYMLQVTLAMTVGLAALLTAPLSAANVFLGTGLLSFAVSDSLIGHAMFHKKPITWSDYFVQPTYIFGMLGIIGYLMLR